MKQSTQKFTCIFVIVFICAFMAGTGYLAITIPQQIEKRFGEPSPYLSTFQRVYLSMLLVLDSEALLTPADPVGQPVLFVIHSGESIPEITSRLYEAGLIEDKNAMRHYLIYSGLDTSLQAGEHSLSPKMNSVEIAQALQDATPEEVNFHILPGWRAEEIAALLPTSGLSFSADSFLNFIHNPPEDFNLVLGIPPGKPLEGFLFPDQYRMPRDITLENFFSSLAVNFKLKVDAAILAGFQQQGLSLYEAITLASLVEREAILEEEMPLIASVFLNRLAAGMKLDADPTVQYALGFNTAQNSWWKNPLSLDDLKINSPYNTYRVAGLPPTPIANPGIKAIRAVAFPETTDYYYFRATCDNSGAHTFSKTFEEHKSKSCP